jgi:tRNA A37 methylthiotransferase MiaB
MLKILFYYDTQVVADQVFVCTAHLYLKTYIEKTNPELGSELHWVVPQQTAISNEELIQLCNDNDVDLLCTSHYVWNTVNLMEQLRAVKPHLNKKTKIIVGGPSVNVHIDLDYFKTYPFVDYAIYGPGENAFLDLIKSLIHNTKLNHEFTSNMSWVDHNTGRKKIAAYQYVPMIKTSPFIYNKELFVASVKKEQDQNNDVALPYDITRGCPYACTFCDWNSGLGNKVSRRKNSYQEELDLFFDLDIRNLFLSDANVGMYDEDVDMIQYMADKNIANNFSMTASINLSKLNFKNNRKIHFEMARGKLLVHGFTISRQDIHDDILQNIDRPDAPWTEHAALIDELEEKFPGYVCQVQLIQGLPGQTPDSWRKTLTQVCSKNVVPTIFVNELLPASPAALDAEYQKKWNFTYSQSLRRNGWMNRHFRGTMAESCVSFSKFDFVKMTTLSHLYSALSAHKFFLAPGVRIDIEPIIDHVLTTTDYNNLENNLWSNWNADKFYFTQHFDGSPFEYSACNVLSTSLKLANNHKLKNIVAKYIDDSEIRKMFIESKIVFKK